MQSKYTSLRLRMLLKILENKKRHFYVFICHFPGARNSAVCSHPSGRSETSRILPRMGSGDHACQRGQVEEAGGTAERQKRYLCVAFGV